MRRLFLASLLFVVACASHVPPTLTPAGVAVWRANQMVVALGTFQHAAIELNKTQVCDPAPCRPLLPDDQTRVVVDAVADALTVLAKTPEGWKAEMLTALDKVDAKLTAYGKDRLKAYTQMVRIVVQEVQ